VGSRPPGGEPAGLKYDRAGGDPSGLNQETSGDFVAGWDNDIDVVLEDPAWRSAVPQVERVARRAAAAAFAEAGSANVLSFPPLHPGMPGDVALALGVVRREARAAGRSVMAHLSHLVAHGVLHLAGHDHLRAGEARRMERAEARVMRRLALPNPWRGVA
jgi:probable rRNA maturation factor